MSLCRPPPDAAWYNALQELNPKGGPNPNELGAIHEHGRTLRINSSLQSPRPPSLLTMKPASTRRRETVVVRKINRDDPEEMRRLSVIDRHPLVLKHMIGKPLSTTGLLDFTLDSRNRRIFALSAACGPTEEIGKLQGWVSVYTGPLVKRRATQALGQPELMTRLSVVEISYAKYPLALKGQMASGLRQVLGHVVAKNQFEPHRPKPLVIAYVDPDNLASTHVLKASGFTLRSTTQFSKDFVWTLQWQQLRIYPHPPLQIEEVNQPFRCLKNSTWRKRFIASSRVLYGPPKLRRVFSDKT